VLIGLFLGPGGDLVGRPPLDLQHAAASSLVTRTGVIVSSIGIGILQGIGPEFVSRGSRPSDGPILPEAGLVLASQTDGAMVASSMLPMRFREEPLQLDRGWLVRLGTAIAPWFSGPPRDTLGADSGDELVGRPDPVEAEHAGVTSDSAFGLSVALITLSSYWMNRWLHRERCQPARRVGLTIRSESTASGGRKG
jgi:hypothetical protein